MEERTVFSFSSLFHLLLQFPSFSRLSQTGREEKREKRKSLQGDCIHCALSEYTDLSTLSLYRI